jgi:DNA-binding beta-propeller fold protein YncE
VVIDAKKRRPVETILTSMYSHAPEGSTPNALAVDEDEETLYVANADNNNICVVEIDDPGESEVLGFIPSGWYPSAVASSPDGGKLYVGNGKGTGSYSNVDGPHSPKAEESGKTTSVKSGQKGAVSILKVEECRTRLRDLTKQAYANCPYNDDLLATAPPTPEKSIVPREVGTGSPVKHVIYIIKENRTYDQVLGDLPQGNGDASLCLFGREITPNIHAIAEQYVLLDNLYCDAEVSVDGHMWSNAAYATDFVEKNWPASYGGKSSSPRSPAAFPPSGFLWDQCARKGLTYRTYGEFAERQSEDGIMEPILPTLGSLHGHVAPKYLSWDTRDTENAKEFLREFEEYEKHFDSSKPEERLPNFIVMALPEDHTHGTRPGENTPRACVASNDSALGMIVARLTRSRYWPEMAVFVIEDDAQDGPDHVDARRTEGLVISPYSRQGIVDSTLYTTSSMLRTMELLLGLQPMSQFDASANPMYKSLCTKANLEPYTAIEPKIDLKETNAKTAWGADASMQMNLSTYDEAPMFELNEIIWKSVKGADSEMPLPVHRFQAGSLK